MAVISLVEGTSYLLYYIGFMVKNVLWILVGAIVERISYSFYPAYVVYEYEVYPKRIREKAYVYHNVLPLASQAITYPVIGYLLGIVSPCWDTLLISLLIIAIASYLSSLLPLYWLPRVGEVSFRKENGRTSQHVPPSLYPIALALILVSFSTLIAPPLILVNLFIKVMGGGLFAISIYETICGVTVIIFSLPLLKIRKEKGRLMVVLGLSLACISNLILAFTKTLEFAFLAAFLASAGFAIMDPFFMDILFSKIPEDKKGTILGSIAGIRKLIGIITPALAGLLAQIFFPGAPYFVSSVFIMMGIVLVLYATK